MYALSDIRQLDMEITSKCQAACPLCPRTGKQDLILSEVTLETFKKWFPESFLMQLEGFYICGNYGDGAIGGDTVEIFEYLRQLNPDISLSLNTNGSARSSHWWTRLAELDVYVIFALDGLEDTHSRYRVNTDFDKIIKNANTFIRHGGRAEWAMIVFDYNEHQINQCSDKANQLGFANFTFEYNQRETSGGQLEVDDDFMMIDCKAVNRKRMFVDSKGDVSACCYLDVVREIDHYNLEKYSLDQIFDIGYFKGIEKTWDSDPLLACNAFCGVR